MPLAELQILRWSKLNTRLPVRRNKLREWRWEFSGYSFTRLVDLIVGEKAGANLYWKFTFGTLRLKIDFFNFLFNHFFYQIRSNFIEIIILLDHIHTYRHTTSRETLKMDWFWTQKSFYKFLEFEVLQFSLWRKHKALPRSGRASKRHGTTLQELLKFKL